MEMELNVAPLPYGAMDLQALEGASGWAQLLLVCQAAADMLVHPMALWAQAIAGDET